MAYKDDCDCLDSLISEYKLPTLSKIAAMLIEKGSRFNSFTDKAINSIIEALLIERRVRLNSDFRWTEEKRLRFKEVNEKLFDSCVKGWEEALNVAKPLHKRQKKKDPFVECYDITVKINIYTIINGNRDVAETLETHLGENYMTSEIGEIFPDLDISTDTDYLPLAVDKSQNWNIEYFGDEFQDYYICYKIHELLDSGIWSFPDILSIHSTWVDVKVSHQHHTLIP